ncbi:MAG TPA: hypothetical protein PLP51_01050 [Acholeplasmataceae bacterium]|nr:hypothetical protein [Acholeplasmataceae bacterium]
MIADIVNAIIQALTGILEGVGGGVVTLFNSLVLTDTGNLSNFGIYLFAMLGVASGFWIFKWVLGLVRNRG